MCSELSVKNHIVHGVFAHAVHAQLKQIQYKNSLNLYTSIYFTYLNTSALNLAALLKKRRKRRRSKESVTGEHLILLPHSAHSPATHF